MSIIPVTVPTGAIRYNTDSNKMECFNGTKWMQVAVSSPDLNGGARGVRGGAQVGGSPYPITDTMDYFTIPTGGNATDFGNLTQSKFGPAGAGSKTRGLFMCGGTPSRLQEVDYIEFSTTGNAQDFGDMTVSRAAGGNSATSNETRAIVATGSSPSSDWTDTIDYVTIASTGNGVDFGNSIAGSGGCQATSSTTRGILCGFSVAPNYAYVNRIDFITMATTGNATDFGGDMLWGGNGRSCSNGIRSVSSSSTPSATTTLQSGFIASRGNFVEYGDLDAANDGGGSFATSGTTRGVFGIMSPGSSNVMQYISMTTSGTAVDFGDLTQAIRNSGATSNAHGGL